MSTPIAYLDAVQSILVHLRETQLIASMLGQSQMLVHSLDRDLAASQSDGAADRADT